jgi:hypothetical protein
MNAAEAKIVRAAITTFDSCEDITIDALRQGAADIRCLALAILGGAHEDPEFFQATIQGIAQRLDAAADLSIETNALDVTPATGGEAAK